MNKKIYFASDFHLGIHARHTSLEREKLLVDWLTKIQDDAAKIYLVGDIFDFWFEYKYVVPKGYYRLLTAFSKIIESNIELEVFTGNHDMWLFDYLQEEFNISVHRKPIIETFQDKIFYIGHGDGLGPGDHGYKFIKKVFANPVCQWLFARLHPNLAFRLAHYWSGKSRESTDPKELKFLGAEREWLISFCETMLKKQHIDYFVFGHRHLPIEYQLSNGKSTYVNLGDWLQHYSYAVFDGERLNLRYVDV